MKRIITIFICLLLAITAVFAGCATSGGDDTTGSSSSSSSSGGNPNAEKKLTVSTLQSAAEYQTMLKWANAYMELNEDVQINVNNNMSAMDIVATWYPNNKMPDIVWTAGDQHSYWSSLNYFEDLRSYAVGEYAGFFEDFYPSLIEATHYSSTDEGIWFVPRDYNQLTFIINKTLLQQAKISIPTSTWTWNDMLDICAKWRAYKTTQKFYPIDMDYSWNPLSVTLMANYDAAIYTDGQLTAKSANMKTCMDDLNDLISNKKYIGQNGFALGFSPMMITVRPNLPTVVASLSESEIMCLPYPTTTTAGNGAGYVGTGCSGYAISKKSSEENKALAWDFLTYCMSEDGYEQVGELGTIVPALQTLANKGSWTEYTDGLGNKFDTSAFTGGLATPISVNFCANLQPKNQAQLNLLLMELFKKMSYSSFDFDASINEFVKSVSNYN